jgi:hypothetical protein
MGSNLRHDGGLFGIKHKRLGFRRKSFCMIYLAHNGGVFGTIVGTVCLQNRRNPINRYLSRFPAPDLSRFAARFPARFAARFADVPHSSDLSRFPVPKSRKIGRSALPQP